MPQYQEYRVTVRTAKGTVQVVISAMDSGSAGRVAQSMFPGSTVTLIETLR
jgi:hypothetical protein